jgi:hypothetical protein
LPTKSGILSVSSLKLKFNVRKYLRLPNEESLPNVEGMLPVNLFWLKSNAKRYMLPIEAGIFPLNRLLLRVCCLSQSEFNFLKIAVADVVFYPVYKITCQG